MELNQPNSWLSGDSLDSWSYTEYIYLWFLSFVIIKRYAFILMRFYRFQILRTNKSVIQLRMQTMISCIYICVYISIYVCMYVCMGWFHLVGFCLGSQSGKSQLENRTNLSLYFFYYFFLYGGNLVEKHNASRILPRVSRKFLSLKANLSHYFVLRA